MDKSLNEVAADKIRKYRADYNNNPNAISFMPPITLTIIITLPLSLLCRLLPVRLGDSIVNLSDFYSYRLIGKLTAFFAASGVQSTQFDRGYFHFRRAAFSSMLKSKCGNILSKTAVLRINLNLDGVPITSKSHTHPSHSQTSRLLTSSLLSLGVPVPRPTQCMRDA